MNLAASRKTNMERQFISLRDAEKLGPFTRRQLREKIHNGTLVQGIHFVKPRRSNYVLIRDAFLAFVQGVDGPLIRERRRPCSSRVNWDLVEGL